MHYIPLNVSGTAPEQWTKRCPPKKLPKKWCPTFNSYCESPPRDNFSRV